MAMWHNWEELKFFTIKPMVTVMYCNYLEK
jgi:hypothetical protein